jgi:hypothetical protein
MNYISDKLNLSSIEHQITDISDIDTGDFAINKWSEHNHFGCRIHTCYLKVVSRTKRFIVITHKNEFVKLSWDSKSKYWGKKQGYKIRYFTHSDELPEGLEIID